MKNEQRLYGCGCKKKIVAATPATTTAVTTVTNSSQPTNVTPSVQEINLN